MPDTQTVNRYANSYAPEALGSGQGEKLHTPYVTFWREGDVICGRFVENLHLSLSVAKAVVEARIEFSRGENVPLLMEITGLRSTTRDARLYMASVGTILVRACAMITRSPVSRTLGNMFLIVDRPIKPAQLFTSKRRAIEWLGNFR